MITLHHLEHSRSQRVLWLLEELGVEYDIVRYRRDPETMLAPPELREVHALGKSPVITEDGVTVAESGAIIEYLVGRHDHGALAPAPGSEARRRWTYWLHYAEGSLMPLLLMKLVFSSLGKPPVPFGIRTLGKALGQGVQKAYLNRQLETHARFIESHLAENSWFAGDSLSMADIQMSFPIFALLARGGIANLPHIQAWKAKVENTPGWQRTLEQGGPLSIPGED